MEGGGFGQKGPAEAVLLLGRLGTQAYTHQGIRATSLCPLHPIPLPPASCCADLAGVRKGGGLLFTSKSELSLSVADAFIPGGGETTTPPGHDTWMQMVMLQVRCLQD